MHVSDSGNSSFLCLGSTETGAFVLVLQCGDLLLSSCSDDVKAKNTTLLLMFSSPPSLMTNLCPFYCYKFDII